MGSLEWRMKTGIAEMDQLLRGGLLIPMAENSLHGPLGRKAEGLLVLVRGEAGTGKSTLAMQIAHNAYWGEKDETAIAQPVCELHRSYSSLEQSPDQLGWRWNEMFPKPSKRRQRVKVDLVSASPQRSARWGPRQPLDAEVPYTTIRGLLDRIQGSWVSRGRSGLRTKKNGAVIVLDGLSIMTPDERHQIRFARLCEELRQFPGICVIVYEPSENGEEILDHRADVVIELEKADLKDPVPYTIHRLQIRKTRYQEAVLGWHQYKFSESGLEIIPSIHFQVHHPRMSLNRIEPVTLVNQGTHRNSGAMSIIEKVVGRLDKGQCVALLGPRGSFKTELSLDFLSAYQPRDNRGKAKSLLVSLLGGGPELEVQCPFAKAGARRCRREFCRLCKPANPKKKRVLSFHQPPGCITPAEFLQKIRRELTDHDDIGRLAFWDLTQLDHRFPLLKYDPLFLPAFLEMLRGDKKNDGPAGNLKHSVESLFMGAGNADYTRAFSAIADNVVFCWRWKPIKPDKVAEAFKRRVEDLEGIPNIKKYLFPSGIGAVPKKGVQKPRFPSEFLLLYVDRTSGKNSQPNKRLYAIPINRGRLPSPGHKSVFNIDLSQLSGLDASEKVLDRIDKINQMQGFE